jgi:hypothetical protein
MLAAARNLSVDARDIFADLEESPTPRKASAH